MGIDWFEFSDETSKELPWLREFIEAGGDYDTPIPVEACSIGTKGILILTDAWKSYVFKGSKIYIQLIEALENYVKSEVSLPCLVASGLEGGKPRLGLNQDDLSATWKKEGAMYFQRYNQNFVEANGKVAKANNPLLPPSQRARK